MSIDPLYTTGSGDRTGTLGRLRGTGDITRVGGMYTAAGLMTGIGIIAMHSIIITTGAPYVRADISTRGIMIYTGV